jgi:hypothetical protein
VQPPELDIINRRPVWAALSCLYLDTELSADDLAHLAEQLADSPYSVDELKFILFAEIHPVCLGNLRQVAGIWSGFDSDWLEARILQRQRAWLRRPAWLFPLRRHMIATTAPVFARIDELRRNSGSVLHR